MRRSFRTRGRRCLTFQGLHPWLVCSAPLGLVCSVALEEIGSAPLGLVCSALLGLVCSDALEEIGRVPLGLYAAPPCDWYAVPFWGWYGVLR